MVYYIYKLRKKDDLHDENIYVGYTRDLNFRLMKHRSKSREAPGRKLYRYVRDNGGWKEFEIIKLCECNETNKRLLEQHFMDALEPTLNCNRSISLEKYEETN